MAEESLDEKRFLPEGMEDLSCRNNDFMPRGHPLAIWYGLRAFLVLVSVEKVVRDAALISTVSSAMNCALFNSGCETPFFLEIKEKSRRMYTGVNIGAGCLTNFDIVHLNKEKIDYLIKILSTIVEILETQNYL